MMRAKSLLCISLVFGTGILSAAEFQDEEDSGAAIIIDATKTTAATQAELAQPMISPERREVLQTQQQETDRVVGEIAAKHPQSPKVQDAAAQQALQARDLDRARAYSDAAVAAAEAKGDKEALADALRTRAAGAWYAGDYPKAFADAKAGLALRPKDERLNGIYQLSRGRGKAAAPPKGAPVAPELDKQLAGFLDDPRVKEAGDRALRRQEAIRLVEEARRRLGMNDPRGALQPLDAAVTADALYADAYMNRALAWTALKDIAKALLDVTKAIELWIARGQAPAAADGLTLRAQLRNKGGDRRGALDDAGRAVALAPGKAGGYAERARALEALGEKAEKVLADFKRAAELAPKDYSADYQAAIARYAQDEVGAAEPQGRSRLEHVILGAVAFLALLAGVVAWLMRRRAAGPPITTRERRRLDSQYDLGEVIGEGGMGAVYKGFDRRLKRPVAVKRLRAELQNNPRERERFLKEAEMVASLHHPHIVDIYTIIQDGDHTFLVFEFVAGKTVHDLLNESPGRRLRPARALELLKQCSEAVDHAHGRHVIHRDLKPSNVMIADGGWVKVMDFGIARQVKDSLLVTTNTIVGTPTYMAPEQAMGQVVKESDVFALGCTLYEMLTGAVPYRGSGELQDKLDGRFVAASTLVPDLGTGIDAVLKQALDPRPERRYRSAAAFYKAASAALDGRATPVA
jgi:tetratricopeptide (TPR) repeat protein